VLALATRRFRSSPRPPPVVAAGYLFLQDLALRASVSPASSRHLGRGCNRNGGGRSRVLVSMGVTLCDGDGDCEKDSKGPNCRRHGLRLGRGISYRMILSAVTVTVIVRYRLFVAQSLKASLSQSVKTSRRTSIRRRSSFLTVMSAVAVRTSSPRHHRPSAPISLPHSKRRRAASR
jgi:hypothetical protein